MGRELAFLDWWSGESGGCGCGCDCGWSCVKKKMMMMMMMRDDGVGSQGGRKQAYIA